MLLLLINKTKPSHSHNGVKYSNYSVSSTHLGHHLGMRGITTCPTINIPSQKYRDTGIPQISWRNQLLTISAKIQLCELSAVISPILFPMTVCRRWRLPLIYSVCHHRLRGSASPVLTATGFVNGKGKFSTPHRYDTPQPITKKFVTGDYVGDPYGCAKLGA